MEELKEIFAQMMKFQMESQQQKIRKNSFNFRKKTKKESFSCYKKIRKMNKKKKKQKKRGKTTVLPWIAKTRSTI